MQINQQEIGQSALLQLTPVTTSPALPYPPYKRSKTPMGLNFKPCFLDTIQILRMLVTKVIAPSALGPFSPAILLCYGSKAIMNTLFF